VGIHVAVAVAEVGKSGVDGDHCYWQMKGTRYGTVYRCIATLVLANTVNTYG